MTCVHYCFISFRVGVEKCWILGCSSNSCVLFCSSLEVNGQTCYKGTDCTGGVVAEAGATASAEACCFSDEGLSYEDTSGTCVETHCAGKPL